jgi:N-acetylglutamate synthase (EC 2.3.1.1)/argininosuccinate lyase (EC 4.3.2.1)
VSKSQLPEKVMKDCEICPRFHACDEVALTYNIAGPATISTFSTLE